ncbi:MAG: L-histidine N(alpha)-methyltransferase, partial [Novosphingobium sp.]
PIEANFMHPIALPQAIGPAPRLGFFPGSTIGNLTAPTAIDLLRAMAGTLGVGAMLLIGMDRVKDEADLVAAYDDAQGVTAAFNLNLAARINGELDGTIPLDALAHRAIWNDERARIEMHIAATRAIEFTVCGRHFAMAAGETIHTENSHKYDPRSADTLLLAGGWEPLQGFGDADDRFMVILARAIGDDQTA